MTAGVVERRLDAWLQGTDSQDRVDLTLRFSEDDSCAVRAVFTGDGVEVEWVMSREVLKAGTIQAAGVGDVHVWPSFARGVVVLRLSSDDGDAELELSARSVDLFLAETETLVPFGEESVNVDAVLRRILGVSR